MKHDICLVDDRSNDLIDISAVSCFVICGEPSEKPGGCPQPIRGLLTRTSDPTQPLPGQGRSNVPSPPDGTSMHALSTCPRLPWRRRPQPQYTTHAFWRGTREARSMIHNQAGLQKLPTRCSDCRHAMLCMPSASKSM